MHERQRWRLCSCLQEGTVMIANLLTPCSIKPFFLTWGNLVIPLGPQA